MPQYPLLRNRFVQLLLLVALCLASLVALPFACYGVFAVSEEEGLTSSTPHSYTAAELEDLLAVMRGAPISRYAPNSPWQEQYEHWENIDAFQDSMASIGADHIIDKEESQHMCFSLEQWTTQMNAAIGYVQNYRETDPQTVEESHRLGNLENEAARALGLLNQTDCE